MMGITMSLGDRIVEIVTQGRTLDYLQTAGEYRERFFSDAKTLDTAQARVIELISGDKLNTTEKNRVAAAHYSHLFKLLHGEGRTGQARKVLEVAVSFYEGMRELTPIAARLGFDYVEACMLTGYMLTPDELGEAMFRMHAPESLEEFDQFYRHLGLAYVLRGEGELDVVYLITEREVKMIETDESETFEGSLNVNHHHVKYPLGLTSTLEQIQSVMRFKHIASHSVVQGKSPYLLEYLAARFNMAQGLDFISLKPEMIPEPEVALGAFRVRKEE